MKGISTIPVASTFENPSVLDILPQDIGWQTQQSFGFSINSNLDLMLKQQEQIVAILTSLQILNERMLEVAFDILKELHSQSKEDLVISHTGDQELLIYRKDKAEYRNLIIDEDGNIVYMYIPADRRNSSNEFYPFMMVDANQLAAKL